MIIPLHLSKSSLSRETCQRSSRPEVPLGIKKEVIFSSILTVKEGTFSPLTDK